MALEGIVTSDWHLGGMYTPLGTRAPELQFAEITKIYNYAAEQGTQKIFIPGDISDTPRMDEDNFVRLVMHLLTWDDSIDTYYMLGNHDVEHKFKTSLDVLKTLVDAGIFKRFKLFYGADTFKIDGVNVSFLPWPQMEAPVADDGRGRLIFAHIEAAGAIGDNGRPLKSGNEDRLVRTKHDYIVSGHIHQYQELASKRLTYVGTPYQKNFGESLPKGFIEFKAGYKKGEKTLRFKHQFVNNHPNFVLESFVVKDQSDWDKLKKDPNIRYKVFVDRNAGVIVPKNLTREYPNVVKLTGVNTASMSIEEVVEAARGEGAATGDMPQFNPLTGLKRFMKGEGMDKAQYGRAKNYVRDAIRFAEAQKSKAA